MRHRVACLSELPEGSGLLVEVAGREIALFRDGSRVHALDAVCPHRGASLAFGEVRGGVVHCPLHAWPFRLADGVCADLWRDAEAAVKVDTFPVTVEGEEVHLEL